MLDWAKGSGLRGSTGFLRSWVFRVFKVLGLADLVLGVCRVFRVWEFRAGQSLEASVTHEDIRLFKPLNPKPESPAYTARESVSPI